MLFGWTTRTLCAFFVAFVALVVGVTGGLAAGTPVSWGNAIEAPGTAALNAGGGAETTSVSCRGTGNCSAGGYYTDSVGLIRAFVQNEKNGVWGAAKQVDGTAPDAGYVNAQVRALSCGSVGNCVAGGYYYTAAGYEAFIVEEKHGVWGKAVSVVGTKTLNVDGYAGVTAVSCANAGNCSVGGYYTDAQNRRELFVADEKKGSWHKATAIPNLAKLNSSDAKLTSLSCASPGYCAAGGSFNQPNGAYQAFVVKEKAGVWQKATPVPGVAALNASNLASTEAVSCGKAGFCAAGGYYTDNHGFQQAFLVLLKQGGWRKAITVAKDLNTYSARVSALSCRSATDCSAGGYVTDVNGNPRAFAATEKAGVWGKASELGYYGTVTSLSCSSAGNCAAAGYYAEVGGFYIHPAVTAQTGGVWGTPTEVPGMTSLTTRDGSASSVSCASTRRCAIVGWYHDDVGVQQAFVTQP